MRNRATGEKRSSSVADARIMEKATENTALINAVVSQNLKTWVGKQLW